MITGNYQNFEGRAGAPVAASALTMYGVWVDAKTMLNRPGARGFFRPYVRYGVGAMSYGQVNMGATAAYEDGFVAGLRAGLGVEGWILSGLRVFADLGPQVTSSFTQAASGVTGDNDPMFTVPIRIGAELSF